MRIPILLLDPPFDCRVRADYKLIEDGDWYLELNPDTRRGSTRKASREFNPHPIGTPGIVITRELQ